MSSKTDACHYFLQPPITVHGIPGRYASALYTSAAKAGKLEAVQEELVEVKHGQRQTTASQAVVLCRMGASSGIDAWICSLTDISYYVQVYNLTGDSPEFEQFLYDPSIPKNKKVPALNAILDKMEVSDVTRQFLGKVNIPLSVFA